MALTNQLYHTSIKIGEDAQTQIDFETADEIHFDVDGTQALRLDSSQIATFASNLSIAASKTSPNVSIGGSSATTAVIELIAEGTSGTSFIDFHAEGAPADYALRVQRFTGANGSARIDNKGTGDIQFYTDGTEGLRIDSSQMLKVAAGSGTTIPTDGQYWWADSNGDMHHSSQGALLVDIDTNANNSDKRFAVRTNAGTTSIFEVNEDGVSFFGDGNGLVVGHTAQLAPGGITPEFQVTGQGAADASMSVNAFSNGASDVPARIWGMRSRAAVGGNTKVEDGDTVLQIAGLVDDGTDYASNAGLIELVIDGVTGSNDTPGAWVFSTTADGAASATEALRIDSSRNATFAGNITVSEDGKIDFSNTAPGTSGDATGVIFSFTAGTTLAVGDVVYMGTGGKVLLADADAATSMPALGICTSASTNTNPVDVMVQGVMKLTGWSFTIGNDIFVSTTAGDVTATAPSGTGDTVQKVGVATASDAAYFNFNTTEVVLA